MNNELVSIISFIIGGLSIFIYGINLMSDRLKSIADYRIRKYIEKYTSNLLMYTLYMSLYYSRNH